MGNPAILVLPGVGFATQFFSLGFRRWESEKVAIL
jgi:hypothetical protein